MNAKNARKLRKHAAEVAGPKDRDRCLKDLKMLCNKGLIKFSNGSNK